MRGKARVEGGCCFQLLKAQKPQVAQCTSPPTRTERTTGAKALSEALRQGNKAVETEVWENEGAQKGKKPKSAARGRVVGPGALGLTSVRGARSCEYRPQEANQK